MAQVDCPTVTGCVSGASSTVFHNACHLGRRIQRSITVKPQSAEAVAPTFLFPHSGSGQRGHLEISDHLSWTDPPQMPEAQLEISLGIRRQDPRTRTELHYSYQHEPNLHPFQPRSKSEVPRAAEESDLS